MWRWVKDHVPREEPQRRGVPAKPSSFKPLSIRRKRTESNPLPPMVDILIPQKQSVDQAQCLLFAKLPAEIRIKIYGYILSEETGVVHIIKESKNKIGYVRCQDACKMQYNFKCQDARNPSAENADFNEVLSGDVPLLPFLQTCQRVYMEAMDVMYQYFTFDFRVFSALIRLSLTMPPQRWNSIRKIHLKWHFGYQWWLDDHHLAIRKIPEWDRVWEIIQRMRGLRELWVDLDAYLRTATVDPKIEAEALEPLMAVAIPPVFVVATSWFSDDTNWKVRNAPFSLLRPRNDPQPENALQCPVENKASF